MFDYKNVNKQNTHVCIKKYEDGRENEITKKKNVDNHNSTSSIIRMTRERCSM
jgi:hypothetical protein